MDNEMKEFIKKVAVVLSDKLDAIDEKLGRLQREVEDIALDVDTIQNHVEE